MSGEEEHAKGRDGAMRAKRWLEATTRTQVHWVNPDVPAKNYLEFTWSDGGVYSFDLGGVLQGGDLNGRMFLAESKKYATAKDQGTEYEKFLGKCYRVLAQQPGRGEVFLWITWAAFWSTRWNEKATPDTIRNAVLKHRSRVLGIEALEDAKQAVDENVITQLSDLLWVLVLSDQQEKHLVLAQEHLAVIRSHIVLQGAKL